jgi:hypothetical protein
VNGGTTSANYPIVNQVPGACRGSCGAGVSEDVFVTEVNPAGNSVIFSTLLGGSTWDDPGVWGGIVVDKAGTIYLTGYTASSDFPTLSAIAHISKACNGTCGTGKNYDAFVAKIAPK